MILIPFIAAVLQAGSFTLDKVILSLRGVDYKTYVGVSFPLTFFITAGIFLAMRPPSSFDLLYGFVGVLVLLSILYTIGGNLIFYHALAQDTLAEMEIIGLLSRVPVIIVASGLFADERNIIVVLCALVASAALIWSHIEHRHFVIRKFTLHYLLWGLLTAPVAASVSKILLASLHPVTLELFRNGGVALILGPLFFRHGEAITIKAFALLIATNALTTVAWILYYFSFQRSGIVYTALIFSLLPLLVYLSSVFVLKERPQWKKNIAFAVVLASIAAAQVFA